MSYKLGSLFDGSGGFPLAGSLCNIEPLWASEVEPYPIAVTSNRFPDMKHLGDISKVRGDEVEPVDIITFGSPCQDLSVAGKRAGLKHEDNGDDETTRSGLFMEAVRIIKEMRKATNGQYPRFAVWENVPGAFSSNNGEDFRIVLQELIQVAEPYAVMPSVPPKGWAYADSYSGDGWSLAYRVFGAQYWGVPQRRRRIYLVADFRGGCAEKILFERESLFGYFEESRTQGQTVATDVERSLGTDDREGAIGLDTHNITPTEGKAVVENVPYTLKIRSGCDVDAHGKVAGKGALIQENMSATLATNNDQYLFQPIGFDGYNATETGDKSATLGVNCGMSTGRNGVVTDTAIAFEPGASRRLGGRAWENIAGTLRAEMGDNQSAVAYGVYSVENHPSDSRVNLDESGKVQTLTSRMGTGGGNVPMVMEERHPVYAIDQGGGKSQANITEDKAPTLCTTHGGEPAVAYSFDPGASRDVGVLFIEECGKTLTNGTCPGHHDGVVISTPIGIGIQSSQGIDKMGENVSPCLINGSNPGWQNGVVVSQPVVGVTSGVQFTGKFTNIAETLRARDYKEPQCVIDPRSRHYIVRRLTPTECARLQGFPDNWGHVEPMVELTEEDYRFWLEVRKTHDAINSKPVKDYNEKQMLTYYNKLWTDSSEYKMWGNGIALPCALYVMQGIKVALDDARSKWLDELLGGD